MTAVAVDGLVTFRLGGGEYATPLAEVREVVRLLGLAPMPGMRPPLAGVVDLRGAALPVLDLRPDRTASGGDVLVVESVALDEADGGPVGVAVDEVRAVLAGGQLPPAGGADRGVLPDYVLDVLRGDSGVVFLVDLAAMVEATRSGSAPAQT